MSDPTEHRIALRVDPAHPVFAGHFPDRPIVPGVLLIDWALAALQDEYPELALPGELGAVKFLRPVPPGAELHIVLRVDRGVVPARVALGIEHAGSIVATATLIPANATGMKDAGR